MNQTQFVCIDFHRPEWTHRAMRQYYIKLDTGRVILVWAFDACDAKDSIRGNIVEYGNR